MHRRRLLALAATLAASVSCGAAASPASAWDASPCGPRAWLEDQEATVQYCPLWRGSVPVYYRPRADSGVAGYLWEAGWAHWFYCQTRGGRLSRFGYSNAWWASTVADNGRRGWVNELYFSGGGNDEPDGGFQDVPGHGLRRC